MATNPLGNEVDDTGNDSDFWSEDEMARRITLVVERQSLDDWTTTCFVNCLTRDYLTIDWWGDVIWLVPMEQLISEALEQKFNQS